MYREPEKTEYEKAVQYDADLLLAASCVMSEMEDLVYDKACRILIRQVAKEYKVSRKDLRARVRELL